MAWTPQCTGTLTFPLWCEDPELQKVPKARTPPTSSSAGQAAWLVVFLPPQQTARGRTCFSPEAPSKEGRHEQSLHAGCAAVCKVMSQTGIITSSYKRGRGGPDRKARGRKEHLEPLFWPEVLRILTAPPRFCYHVGLRVSGVVRV